MDLLAEKVYIEDGTLQGDPPILTCNGWQYRRTCRVHETDHLICGHAYAPKPKIAKLSLNP